MRQIVVVATANAFTDVVGLDQGSDQTVRVEKGQATKVVARGHQKTKEENEMKDLEDHVVRFIVAIIAVHLVNEAAAAAVSQAEAAAAVEANKAKDRTGTEEEAAKAKEAAAAAVRIKAPEQETEEDPEDSTEVTSEDPDEVLEKTQIQTIKKAELITKDPKRMRVVKGGNLNVRVDVVLMVVSLVLAVTRSKILMLKELIPTPAEVELEAKWWSLVK